MSSFKKTVKKILVWMLFYSGLPFIFREFIQKKKITILVLHDPDVAIGSGYFVWLSRHYNIISLDKYLSTRVRGFTTRLPPKSLIITLDDGHIGNYKLLPLVKQYNIPLTIFLCSGIINTSRHYWFRFSGLPSSSESLKVIANHDRLRILSESGFYPEKEFAYPQALNRNQILEMKEYINFQTHTIFHPCLPQCSDEESLIEIEQSKRELEQKFNLSINALAYPNGDYSERDIQFAQKTGYFCGLTVGHGFNDGKTDLFKLRRLSVSDRDSMRLLAIKASGIWAFLKYVLGKLTGIKESIK